MQAASPHPPSPQSPIQVESILEEFAQSLDVKPVSRRAYIKGVRRLLEWLEANNKAYPDRRDVLEFREKLAQEGLAPLTVSCYLVAARRFFQWLEQVNLYPDITKGIRGAKCDRGFRKDALSLRQVQHLLGSIDTDTRTGLRDYALVRLAIGTALRTIEIVRADVADLRQKEGKQILWVHGKGRDTKDEFVVIPWDVYRVVQDYLSTRPDLQDTSPLFASEGNRSRGERLCTTTVSKVIKRRLRAAGLDSKMLTAHSLRHTGVTLALIAGASLQQTKAMARHSDINTTLRYAHNLERVEDAPEERISILLAGRDRSNGRTASV